MGANLILKYAGEQGEESVVDAFCALCTPFDIVICSRFLSKKLPHNFIPDKFLVDNMVKIIKTNEAFLRHHVENVDFVKLYKSKSSFEFDSEYTCKMLGYKNPEHYYRDSSCVEHLHNIRRPTLAISAIDDPVVTGECIPYEEFKTNGYLLLALTRRGGHIGWFTGGLNPKRVRDI